MPFKPPTRQSFMAGFDRLVEFFKWSVEGMQGVSCSCGEKVNMPTGGAGWVCVCGRYNVLSWSGHMVPWEQPTLGPCLELIHAASLCAGDDPSCWRGQYAIRRAKWFAV